MKILHVTTDTNYGGVQECVLGLCRYAAVHGGRFRHHVLRVTAGGLEAVFRRYADLHDAGDDHENAVSVIKQVKPDIVHMHMPGGRFPHYAEQIAATGVPLVENIHCVHRAAHIEEEVMSARIVNSRYVYNLQACKEKLYIIPHAIDQEGWSEAQSEAVREAIRATREKEFGIPPGTTAVGRIGNITGWKKVTDFIQAVPCVLRGMTNGTPQPAFLLAGAVHEFPEYAAMMMDVARMLFVGDRIRFLWNVAKKFVFLGTLDVFLYPTSREGYCIAAIEAMSMGLPVVTYRDSAMPETVPPEAGELVAMGDIQGLANAVISLLENPQMLAAKSNAARNLVLQRNMPEVVFPAYEHVYEQCVR